MNTYTTIQTKVISFRVSHEEYNQLINAANDHGQRIGQYCYNKIFSGAKSEKENPPAFNPNGTLEIEENIQRLEEKLKSITK